MNTIEGELPCDAEVTLIYRCPKCSCEHKLTRKETEYPGIVYCCCKTKFKVRQIQQIKVTPLYRDINRKNFFSLESKEVQEAIQALIGLGYKKREISQKMAGLLEVVGYNNVDKLVEDFLRKEQANGKS